MARIQYTSYRKSKLATIISFLSSLIFYFFLLGAVASLFGGEFVAAVAVFAVGLVFKVVCDQIAEAIARRKK